MSVIKSETIEVSATVPELDDTEAQDYVPFNDLEIVGGLPASLNVVGINDIVVYNTQNDDDEEDFPSQYVVGIETVYRLDDGRLSPPVLHGTKTKYLTRFRVASHERIIAAFVGVSDEDDEEKKIRALSFTMTNVKTGEVQTKGYISGPADGDSFTFCAAFGEIVAFQGIKSRAVQGSLIALGVQTRCLESS